MELKDILSAYMDEHKISQRELSRRCDISHQTIANIIKGTNSRGKPLKSDVDTLEKLSKGTGIPVSKLMGYESRRKAIDSVENELGNMFKEYDSITDEDRRSDLLTAMVNTSSLSAKLYEEDFNESKQEVFFDDSLVDIINGAVMLSPENRKMLLKYMQFTFPEAFE